MQIIVTKFSSFNNMNKKLFRACICRRMKNPKVCENIEHGSHLHWEIILILIPRIYMLRASFMRIFKKNTGVFEDTLKNAISYLERRNTIALFEYK